MSLMVGIGITHDNKVVVVSKARRIKARPTQRELFDASVIARAKRERAAGLFDGPKTEWIDEDPEPVRADMGAPSLREFLEGLPREDFERSGAARDLLERYLIEACCLGPDTPLWKAMAYLPSPIVFQRVYHDVRRKRR